MKLRLLRICAGFTMLYCGSMIVANVVQGPEIKTIPLKFKPGTSSITVTGTIKEYPVTDYKFRASGGQTLKAKLITKSTSLYFNVMAAEKQASGEALAVKPRPIEQTEWQAKLPQDGDYIIRVYLYQNEARRGNVASYALNVAIK